MTDYIDYDDGGDSSESVRLKGWTCIVVGSLYGISNEVKFWKLPSSMSSNGENRWWTQLPALVYESACGINVGLKPT